MTAADRPHGPLPVLLVCLTVVTGLVDAFSYLRLGHEGSPEDLFGLTQRIDLGHPRTLLA